MYCLRLSEIVTLSGDQNEVFESLINTLYQLNVEVIGLYVFKSSTSGPAGDWTRDLPHHKRELIPVCHTTRSSQVNL